MCDQPDEECMKIKDYIELTEEEEAELFNIAQGLGLTNADKPWLTELMNGIASGKFAVGTKP